MCYTYIIGERALATPHDCKSKDRAKKRQTIAVFDIFLSIFAKLSKVANIFCVPPPEGLLAAFFHFYF